MYSLRWVIEYMFSAAKSMLGSEVRSCRRNITCSGQEQILNTECYATGELFN